MKNDEIFSETEDTKLKQFLTGGRVYSQLAVAIISALVLILTFSGIFGIYSNVSQAKNVKDITGLDVSKDLDGQYVSGAAYKFLAKLGYIAESDRAATHYYYLMYLDASDGEQYLTLVEAPKDMDPTIQNVIDSFLTYVQNPDSAYMGGAFSDLSGRFKKMSSSEESMMSSGISTLGLTQEKTVNYTLKLGPLPKKSDTVAYWFIAVPFCAAFAVSTVLFIYGTSLENKRAEANKSPYPYLNRKKK